MKKNNIAAAAVKTAKTTKAPAEIVGEKLVELVKKDPKMFVHEEGKTEWKFDADLGKGKMSYRMVLGEEMAKSGRRCHKHTLFYTAQDGSEKVFQFGNPWKKKYLYTAVFKLTHPAKARAKKADAKAAIKAAEQSKSEIA